MLSFFISEVEQVKYCNDKFMKEKLMIKNDTKESNESQ